MSSNFNCSYMAMSSLTYILFLAHLAFRPCELLPSLFVRPSTFHILISPQKPPGQLQSNFGGMVLGWLPLKIMSGDPDFQPKWPPS